MHLPPLNPPVGGTPFHPHSDPLLLIAIRAYLPLRRHRRAHGYQHDVLH